MCASKEGDPAELQNATQAAQQVLRQPTNISSSGTSPESCTKIVRDAQEYQGIRLPTAHAPIYSSQLFGENTLMSSAYMRIGTTLATFLGPPPKGLRLPTFPSSPQ